MIETVFVTVLTVAVTFLATVRWARLGPDGPPTKWARPPSQNSET